MSSVIPMEPKSPGIEDLFKALGIKNAGYELNLSKVAAIKVEGAEHLIGFKRSEENPEQWVELSLISPPTIVTPRKLADEFREGLMKGWKFTFHAMII